MIRFGVFSSASFSLKETTSNQWGFHSIQAQQSFRSPTLHQNATIVMVSVEDMFATNTDVFVLVCSILFSHPIHTRLLTWSTLPMQQPKSNLPTAPQAQEGHTPEDRAPGHLADEGTVAEKNSRETSVASRYLEVVVVLVLLICIEPSVSPGSCRDGKKSEKFMKEMPWHIAKCGCTACMEITTSHEEQTSIDSTRYIR